MSRNGLQVKSSNLKVGMQVDNLSTENGAIKKHELRYEQIILNCNYEWW